MRLEPVSPYRAMNVTHNKFICKVMFYLDEAINEFEERFQWKRFWNSQVYLTPIWDVPIGNTGI